MLRRHARIAKDICLLTAQSDQGTPACGSFACTGPDQNWLASQREEKVIQGLRLPDNRKGLQPLFKCITEQTRCGLARTLLT
jgi:hypothetical protein